MPSSRRNSCCSARAVPTTCAPRALATWTARWPTPPAAAWIRTRSPSPTRAVSTTVCQAVRPASGRPPAYASGRASGASASWRDGAVTNSAFALARRGNHGMPKTRSPGAKRVTPSPTSSTVPATSQPRIIGGSPIASRRPPCSRVFQSTGLIPAAVTLTRTSVGIGFGRSTSLTSRTSGPPNSRITTAFTSRSSHSPIARGASPPRPGRSRIRDSSGRALSNRPMPLTSGSACVVAEPHCDVDRLLVGEVELEEQASLPPPLVYRGRFLRPTGAPRRRVGGEHLASSRPLEHVLGAVPLGCHHEQRPPVGAAERAGEAPPVELDRLEHLAALANAHATLVGDVAVPDGVLGVDADAVGDSVAEVGPHPPVREAALVRDVERREAFPVGVGDDQGRAVRGHVHAVGEGDVIGHLATRAIWGDQRHSSWGELRAGHHVEAGAVDVGVATIVHDQLVPRRGIGDAG